MNFNTTVFVALLGLISMGSIAEENNPQAQLDEINAQIKMEQETNQNLKDDLAARDQEIADLKLRFKELEEQAAKK